MARPKGECIVANLPDYEEEEYRLGSFVLKDTTESQNPVSHYPVTKTSLAPWPYGHSAAAAASQVNQTLGDVVGDLKQEIESIKKLVEYQVPGYDNGGILQQGEVVVTVEDIRKRLSDGNPVILPSGRSVDTGTEYRLERAADQDYEWASDEGDPTLKVRRKTKECLDRELAENLLEAARLDVQIKEAVLAGHLRIVQKTSLSENGGHITETTIEIDE